MLYIVMCQRAGVSSNLVQAEQLEASVFGTLVGPILTVGRMGVSNLLVGNDILPSTWLGLVGWRLPVVERLAHSQAKVLGKFVILPRWFTLLACDKICAVFN